MLKSLVSEEDVEEICLRFVRFVERDPVSAITSHTLII